MEALSSYQGAIIAVSHDEAFVNRLVAASASDVTASETQVSKGEIWVLSKQNVSRFDGSFKDYKNLIMKKVLKGGTAGDLE